MAILLSTNSVRQVERFAFWREAVCDAYVHLDCECSHPDEFDGEIVLNRLSRLSASFVSGSQQSVRRRRKDIARAGEESFLISLQMKREGSVSQHERSARLQPGDFALYSSVDRYRLELPDGFRQLVVQIPREDLLSRLPTADLLTGIRVLLYDQRYTTKGVQKIFKDEGVKYVSELGRRVQAGEPVEMRPQINDDGSRDDTGGQAADNSTSGAKLVADLVARNVTAEEARSLSPEMREALTQLLARLERVQEALDEANLALEAIGSERKG